MRSTTSRWISAVSIHAPVKGATSSTLLISLHADCFNPRSREGSDAVEGDAGGRHPAVSIHAPVKGATAAHLLGAQGYLVSIHAPVKGATQRA